MNRSDRRLLAKKGKLEQFAGVISREATKTANTAATVNSMTLSMWVLHNEFKFGGERLKRFYRHMAEQAQLVNEHYVKISDIQTALNDECGIDMSGGSKDA